MRLHIEPSISGTPEPQNRSIEATPFIVLACFVFLAGCLQGTWPARFHYGWESLAYFALAGLLLLFPAVSRVVLNRDHDGNVSVSVDLARAIQSTGIGGRQTGKSVDAVRAVVRESVDPEDPQKGRWGGQSESQGRKLSGRISPIPSDPGLFRIELTVTSADRERPLKGSVRFHLHPTFRTPNPEVQVQSGEAKLLLVAWGAFTVGADTDDGASLELDLMKVPGGTKGFYAS